MKTKGWFLLENDKTSMIVHDTPENVRMKKHLDWTLCSGPYALRDNLIHSEGVLDKPCTKCGRVVATNYSNKEDLIADNICFGCWFWKKYVARKDDYDVVRVKGEHYVIQEDDPKSYFKGFGGSEFKIRFHSGREVISHNLWYQGVIPEHFRAELPDNAVFI